MSCGCLKREAAKALAKKQALGFPAGQTGSKLYYKGVKQSAAKRGHSFHLTRDQVCFIVSQDCVSCGRPPHIIKKNNKVRDVEVREHGAFVHNTLDRIDSRKGYTIDNVQSMCLDCNRSKWRMSDNERYTHVIKMCRHLKIANDNATAAQTLSAV